LVRDLEKHWRESSKEKLPTETPEEFQTRKVIEIALIQKDHMLEDHHVLEAVRAVIERASPYQALCKQKEWMRNHCRMPEEMRFRIFADHIKRINDDELPYLPPFADQQALSDNELIALLRRGAPKAWKGEMIKQSFDHDTEPLDEVITFFENQENADIESGSKTASTPRQEHSAKKNKPTANKPTKKEGGKWCDFHKTDTHSNEECRNTKPNGNGNKYKKPNTWANKANASKTYTKQELNVLIKKVVTKEKGNWVKKAKAKTAGKRKTEEANMLETVLTNTVDVDDIDSDATEAEVHDTDDMTAAIAKTLNDDFEEFNID
jgi:hypothetical protein